MSKMTKAETAEREEVRDRLRAMLPVGTTVYAEVVQVARSGMSRHIAFYVPERDETTGKLSISNITGMVGRATGYRRNDRTGGLVIGGCGMDVRHHVVQSLSYALHGYGREDDSPAQVAAREGPLALGVQDFPPRTHGPGRRTAGYTLDCGNL